MWWCSFPGSTVRVCLPFDLSGDNVQKTVTDLLDEWQAMGQLYQLVTDFADSYNGVCVIKMVFIRHLHITWAWSTQSKKINKIYTQPRAQWNPTPYKTTLQHFIQHLSHHFSAHLYTHTHRNHWRTIAHRQGIESRGYQSLHLTRLGSPLFVRGIGLLSDDRRGRCLCWQSKVFYNYTRWEQT